ncbi:MAG: ATP-binding cassette domain-containing protein [Salinivirgaceae bacterium]|nr:ATP-binding cassette domain-containing protein [Salinivirgaceae bacterium]
MDIIVKNLTKFYGQQKAVDNLSFEVKAGEILGFLGPNGAGKTTTMKAIAGFLTPTGGDITIGRYSVRDNPEMVKQMIGYLPEHNPLYTDMNVIDYLRYMAQLQRIRASKINDRILEMVNVCGLEGEKHKRISELSKGYRQRVGLAQALIHDPQVFILDEPTTGLDPNQIVEIRELIRKIGREKTIILSSHILAEVEATCDRILIINKGRIVADGTADQLRKASSGCECLRITVEDADRNDVVRTLQSIDTVELVDTVADKSDSFEVQSRPGESSRRAVFRACVENGWVLTELSPVETKLEDIFRELTKQ